jgi:hypothetical protein
LERRGTVVNEVSDDEPQDPNESCFACQNMDAYWAEKARHDPALRARLAELERMKAAAVQGAPAATEVLEPAVGASESSAESRDSSI